MMTLDEPLAVLHGQYISQTCGKVALNTLEKLELLLTNNSLQLSAINNKTLREILGHAKFVQVHVSYNVCNSNRKL